MNERAPLRARLAWCSLAAAFLAADLWSKHLVFYPHVLDHTAFREGMLVGRVTTGWNTILVYNQGVTFGAFAGVPWWVKSILTGAVIAWLVGRLLTLRPRLVAEPLALSAIVGGAVGNLYDRALRPFVEPDTRPGVRDFLDWYAPEGTWLADWLTKHEMTTHWYTSNVADVLIVCGVILLAITMFREPAETPAAPPESAQ